MSAIRVRTPAADRAEILRALRLLGPPDAVRELRIIETPRDGTVGGYFNDPELLATEAVRWSGKAPAIYVTLNELPPSAIARRANRLETRVKATTTDADITRRLWLPIDTDPSRLRDTSSTEEEHTLSLERIRQVTGWLTGEMGWPAPVLADSGNGGHALFSIDLPNDDEHRDLVERCLKALAARFDDERVTIDQKVFNAARIWKLYGTPAAKGDCLEAWPHRLARLLQVPEHLEIVAVDPLRVLASLAPAEAPKAKGTGSAATTARPGGSDLKSKQWMETFIERTGLAVDLAREWQGGWLWQFPVCPFNPDHCRGEARITVDANGQIAAGCFHNSCTWDWHALRDRLEPGSRSGKHPERTDAEAPGPARKPRESAAALTGKRAGGEARSVRKEAAPAPPAEPDPPAWAPSRLIAPGEAAIAARGTFIDDYADYAALRTDAPRVFHEAHALVALSVVVGRGAVLRLSTGDLFPALWIMVIAESTIYRKSTALDLLREIVVHVDADLLCPGDFTPQRFLGILAENDGNPLVLFRDEFSGFLDGLVRHDHMAGMKEILCSVYDCRGFHRQKMRPKAKKGETADDSEWKFEVKSPFLSLAVGTTPERFSEVVRPGDLYSGFLPRFAPVLPPLNHREEREAKPVAEVTPATLAARDALVERLKALRERYITLTVAPEVFDRFARYQAELESEAGAAPDSELVAITGDRCCWMALKIAMLLAAAAGSDAADRSRRVDLSHLLRGIEIAEGWRHNAVVAYGSLAPSRFERLAARVVQRVDEKCIVSRRDLMNGLHLSKRDMLDIEATLLERGQIRIAKEKTRTTPSIRYESVKDVALSQLSRLTI